MQAVRIMRLSKFLRALSKHPTIQAVFETVAVSMSQVSYAHVCSRMLTYADAVSMSQVINIVIVLCLPLPYADVC
jgi:hypothetical protein